MKSMWKKSISILFIFLLIFSITMLTACKTSGDSSSANNGQQNPPVIDNEITKPPVVDETTKPPVIDNETTKPPIADILPDNPKPEPEPMPEPEPTPPVKPEPEPEPEPTPDPTPTEPSEPEENPPAPEPTPPQPENPVPPTPENPKPITPTDPYNYTPHLSKTMPEIRITTETGSNDFANQTGDNYYTVGISVDNCEDIYKKKNVGAQIKVRGNSTRVYDKKPFRIKFAEKQSMLGLNNNAAEKDWVLLANYKDASLLRNSIGFYLGKLMYGSTGLYTSDFINVELYLNGEYWGIYLLCEQNQVSDNRVNITQVPKNYTGTDIGYLLEYDCYAKSEAPLERFTINYNNKAKLPLYDETRDLMVGSPNQYYAIKSKVYSETQRDFIANYLENVYRICYRAIVQNTFWEFNADKTDIVQVYDTDARTVVEKVVDLESAAVMYIMQEIACDYDLQNSSFYMTVDLGPSGDGKLRFQVPWDFDTALGFQPALAKIDEVYAAGHWGNPWSVLFYKPDFMKEKMKEKWQAMKNDKIEEKIAGYIEYCIQNYADYYAKNFTKWENIGKRLKIEGEKYENKLPYNEGMADMYWAFPELAEAAQTQADYATYLKLWLQHRLQFIDSQFLPK